MKILKVILLIIWVLSTALFIIGSLTPLDFTYKWFLYVTFMISFNGIFLLTYLLADFIKFDINRLIIGFICSLLLMMAYYFYPVEGGWQTQQILYRQKSNPDNLIVFQEEQLGAFGSSHRVVKIINIPPLFEWKIPMKKVEADSSWLEVNEHITR